MFKSGVGLCKRCEADVDTMPRYYRKDALILFFLLAFANIYFYQESGWNGNSRFGLIFSMVEQRRLTIDSYQNRKGTQTEDKAYFNGHYYSDKAIGPAVVGAMVYAPIYWAKPILHGPDQTIVKMILTFLVIGLPSAVAGSLIYILCLYLSKNRFRSFWVTLTVSLGTMAWPYSTVFFSHQFSSSLLFSAFFMIFFLKERVELGRSWYFFLIGFLLGWAVISEFPAAVIVLALLVYYILTMWKDHFQHPIHSIGLPMLGGAIPVSLQLIYNKICFKGFFSFGYSNLKDPYFSSAMGQGVMGFHWPNLKVLFYMTLHPTMGLFWQSPVLILAVIGAVYMILRRRYRNEAILAIWIIGSYLVLMSGYYLWWGGYALGPRHIIPILPFFCILLAIIPNRLHWPLVILSLVSIGQMLAAAATTVQVPDTMVSKISSLGFFEYSNIYSFNVKQLFEDNFSQNLARQLLGLQSWSSLIPLFIIMLGTSLYFFRNEITKFYQNKFHPVIS